MVELVAFSQHQHYDILMPSFCSSVESVLGIPFYMDISAGIEQNLYSPMLTMVSCSLLELYRKACSADSR